MWTKCPDGVYRLDCARDCNGLVLHGLIKNRDGKYRLFIEGFGSFREPKTLKEVNEILARHGLWPFQETDARCPQYEACIREMSLVAAKAA
ncbi:MAG TPA: hypothetical protein VLV18_08785 [Terriglobales bacterium]|nr:hypothetical protein [Terriglobales bacterium]